MGVQSAVASKSQASVCVQFAHRDGNNPNNMKVERGLKALSGAAESGWFVSTTGQAFVFTVNKKDGLYISLNKGG